MSTLAALKKRFYARFDEQAQNYISNDEVVSLLNEGGAQLHNWLVTEGEAYTWQETTLPLVSKQKDYPLPDNFLKMLKVYAADPAAQYMEPLPRIMPQEYRGAQAVTAYGSPSVCGYMIIGQTLRLMPEPQGTHMNNIVYWWVPQYVDLVADTDKTPISMFAGAEEFIVNHAVIGARLKEESDTSGLERRQQQIMELLQQTFINRDMGQHAHVVDASSPWQ